ncbi:hypothetical protein DN395_01775 [Bacillus sp. AR18-7]|nr:hypothetical protein DN395_01775 [Bacillus sp. AR18-7]
MDGSPIHIIKIKMVQVGGRHLRVSFLFYKKRKLHFKTHVKYKITDFLYVQKPVIYFSTF